MALLEIIKCSRHMTFEHWLAFCTASAIMLAIPGPTIVLVISYALGHGRKAAAATVSGVALGDFTAMTVSLAGLGVVLSTSAAVFTVLKWVGAAYLIWLGVKLWRAPVEGSSALQTVVAHNNTRIFAHSFIVTALNPKSIVFFVAFLPQFIVVSEHMVPQMIILELTFLTLATVNATLYAALASAAKERVQSPRVQRLINRTGGSLLIGAGVLTAGLRRANG